MKSIPFLWVSRLVTLEKKFVLLLFKEEILNHPPFRYVQHIVATHIQRCAIKGMFCEVNWRKFHIERDVDDYFIVLGRRTWNSRGAYFRWVLLWFPGGRVSQGFVSYVLRKLTFYRHRSSFRYSPSIPANVARVAFSPHNETLLW